MTNTHAFLLRLNVNPLTLTITILLYRSRWIRRYFPGYFDISTRKKKTGYYYMAGTLAVADLRCGTMLFVSLGLERTASWSVQWLHEDNTQDRSPGGFKPPPSVGTGWAKLLSRRYFTVSMRHDPCRIYCLRAQGNVLSCPWLRAGHCSAPCSRRRD